MVFWNPNNPEIAGTEYYPTRTRLTRLIQGLRGCSFKSTVTEDISSLRPYVHAIQNGVAGTCQIGVDVYEKSAITAPVEGALTVPGGNSVLTDDWTQCTTGPLTCGPTDATAYSYIADNATEDLNVFEQFFTLAGNLTVARLTVGGPPTPATATFQSDNTFINVDGSGSVTDPNTGQRIASVEVVIIAQNRSAKPILVDGLVSLVGVADYRSENGPATLGPGQIERLVFTWKWNPANGRQWRNADVAQFAVGSTRAFGVWVNCAEGVSMDMSVGVVNLVFRELDEKRVATGYANLPTTPAASHSWRDIPLLAPDDHAPQDWSKVSGTSYAVFFFVTGFGGLIDLTGVDSSNAVRDARTLASPPNEWLSAAHTVLSLSAIPKDGGSLVLDTAAITSLTMVRDDAATSVDAQPYVMTRVHEIKNGQEAIQQISTTGTLDYGIAKVVVGTRPGTDAPLEIRLRHATTNALLAGPVTIEPGTGPNQCPADGKAHHFRRRFTSGVPLAADDVYVEMTTQATVPWLVYGAYSREYVNTTAAFNVVAASQKGIGGTTDVLLHLGVPDGTGDIMACIISVPDDLTGLDVNIETLEQTVSSCSTAPLLIEYALLEWDSSTLDDDFAFYNVQRLNPLTDEWGQIAEITLEAASWFPDFEPARNVPTSYRVRVHSTLGSFSDWTNFTPITVTTPKDCSIVLASNHAPELTLGYEDSPGHSYQRANSGDTVAHLIEGRQRPVTFRALIEGESDVFGRRLIIAGNNANAAPFDRAPFDPLITLLESDAAPQIVLCDGRGRQWYTAAEFVKADFDQPGNVHHAEVKFTEIDGPALVTVAVPWEPAS